MYKRFHVTVYFFCLLERQELIFSAWKTGSVLDHASLLPAYGNVFIHWVPYFVFVYLTLQNIGAISYTSVLINGR